MEYRALSPHNDNRDKASSIVEVETSPSSSSFNNIKGNEDVNDVAAFSWPEQLQEGFALNQTTSQCCRCCCFQPNIHWRVFSYKVN